jgi:hypothetical protein
VTGWFLHRQDAKNAKKNKRDVGLKGRVRGASETLRFEFEFEFKFEIELTPGNCSEPGWRCRY